MCVLLLLFAVAIGPSLNVRFCFLFLSVCTRVRECVRVCAAAVAVVDAIRLSLLCPNCFVVVVDFTYFCTEGHVLQ